MVYLSTRVVQPIGWKSGNRSTCWAHFCGVALKSRKISRHVPNSRHAASNMAVMISSGCAVCDISGHMTSIFAYCIFLVLQDQTSCSDVLIRNLSHSCSIDSTWCQKLEETKANRNTSNYPTFKRFNTPSEQTWLLARDSKPRT